MIYSNEPDSTLHVTDMTNTLEVERIHRMVEEQISYLISSLGLLHTIYYLIYNLKVAIIQIIHTYVELRIVAMLGGLAGKILDIEKLNDKRN